MSHDFVLDLIRQADPYPNEGSGLLTTDPESVSETLTEIDMRSRTMQTREPQTTDSKKQKWFRPSLGAAAAAAVVVIAGLGIWLAAGGDGDEPVVDRTSPVDIAQEFLNSLNAGSADAAAALVSADHSGIIIPVVGRLTGLDDRVGFFEFYASTNGRTDFSGCAEEGAQAGSIVTCDITQTSDLSELLQTPPIEGSITFRIAEGQIRSAAVVVDFDAIASYRAAREALDEWIRENRPEAAAELFDGDRVVWSGEAARAYLELAGEYVIDADN